MGMGTDANAQDVKRQVNLNHPNHSSITALDDLDNMQMLGELHQRRFAGASKYHPNRGL
jgi:hypothetical protein